jgi:hypothetical protein
VVRLATLVGGMALAVGMLAPAGVPASDDPPTVAVVSFESAIDAADVSTSASLFADDAVVIQPRVAGLPEIYVGNDQIRWWLSGLIAQHAWFEPIGALQVDGDHVRWSDQFAVDAFRQLGLNAVDVESDALINADGQIAWLRTELTAESARRINLAPVGPI